jgi:hypothetical protein
MENFIITQTPLGAALTLATAAGEVATELVWKAQNKLIKNNPYGNVIPTDWDIDPTMAISSLGTEVWDQVTFGKTAEETSWKDSNGTTYILPVMTFQSILINVSFPRNIVKTVIEGRDGTVKEYIGEGDAHITFTGVICGKNGHYPLDEVQMLRTIMTAPIAIPVSSNFLHNLRIYSVVFEDRTLEQQEGGYSYQTFTLNAISDTPQELIIS